MIDKNRLREAAAASERAAEASARDYEDFLDLCRIDFPAFSQAFWEFVNPGTPFMPNWHLEAIAYRLQQCADRKIKRLIINLPPRHGKSFLASMAFPAWLLGHDPTARILAVAYGEDLAGEHARGSVAIMKSPLYREVFPGTRISAKRSRDDDFQTTERGGRLATTVGGALTGRGGSFIIIDDPIKAGDVDSEVQRKKINDWYDNTLTSRLDQPKEDVIILVMQRVHIDDMAGKLIERGGFELLNLAAIAPTDETIEIGQGRFHTRLAGEALHPERMPLELAKRVDAEKTGNQPLSAVTKVVVSSGGVEVTLNPGMLRIDAVDAADPGAPVILRIATSLKTFGGSKQLMDATGASVVPQGPDLALQRAIGRARVWASQIENGERTSSDDIAAAEGIQPRYVEKVLGLAWLAPDITEAILDGRRLRDFNLTELLSAEVPASWAQQRAQLSLV